MCYNIIAVNELRVVYSAHVYICHIKMGTLQVADNLVHSSSMPVGAQPLVTEAQVEVTREKFSFGKKKTKTMVISSIKMTQPRNSL